MDAPRREGGWRNLINTLVISGFPGVGKSHLFQTNKSLVILDSDSSGFSWSGEGIRNPAFPRNYIEYIQAHLGKAPLILVSSHKSVRDALRESGIAYTLVYPDRGLKSEYLQRFRDRGSDETFVQMIDRRWDEFLTECEAETWPTRRVLWSGKFLSDVCRELIYLVMCNGRCGSGADDYCGMHLNIETCPACDAMQEEAIPDA